MGRVDIAALTPEQLSQNLLECVKKGRMKEAFPLVDNGADSNIVDQAGNTALHHAALGGNVDLVIKMIQNGGNVRKMDQNGETPIHKAARRGHIETIVALVAYDGDINVLNQLGQRALELAVITKDAETVKLCCKLGTEAALQDWQWTNGDIKSLAKKERGVLDILLEQTSRYPGYQYGGIIFKVLHVQPGTDILKVQNPDISIKTSDLKNHFFLYCGKMHPEYSDISVRLQPDENIFSDVYEFMTWGSKQPSQLTLELVVSGVPGCSERLSLKRLEGTTVGEIFSFEIIIDEEQEDASYTIVTVTIPAGRRGSVIFAIVTTEIPETFMVTAAAVSIQPTMEPEAQIDIPQGTFEGQGHLEVNVAETKQVVCDEGETEEPLLITNIIDLSMSDGKQPKKSVKMTLPVHTQTDSDIVILASQEEFPEDEDDWEILETENKKKFVTFDVSHFSFYVAGSKSQFKMAAKLANQALRKERKIEIFAMVKYESNQNSTIVVECVLKRHGKARRKKWKEKGFASQSPEYFECAVHSGLKFKLTFSDSIPVQDQNEDIVLIFNQRKRKNYRTFSLLEQTSMSVGDIKIDKILEKRKTESDIESPKAKKKSRRFLFICGGNSVVVETSPKPVAPPPDETEYISSLTVAVKPPESEEDEYDRGHMKIDSNDPECPIKCTVLRFASLKKLGDNLTDAEMFNLGGNLGVLGTTLQSIEKDEYFRDKLFQRWRPKRPYVALVETLKKGLERIDRRDLARMVEMAYEREEEFKYSEDSDEIPH